MPSRWDDVQTSDGDMRCYVSAPDRDGPSPGVVVIQHAGGVDQFIRTMTDRFADEGFAAIAPDLYHREDPNTSDDPLTRMGRLRDPLVISDVNVAIDHFRALPGVDSNRVGITGFCMGGRVAYLMAAENQALKAAVVFYGGNTMISWGGVETPFEMTDRIACPLLGLFGEDDPNPNPDDVARIDAELTKHGKTHEFHSYPGAGHAFMNEGRPSYRPDAATDAWQKCVSWFNHHLR